MKRIKALIVSIFLSCIILFCFFYLYGRYMNKKFEAFYVKNNSIRYSDSFSKYKSHDAICSNITKNTILLMGSSELIVNNNFEEHPKYLLDYSDKNIMQIGEGYFQSLIHAITLASIGEEAPVKSVNLILSMQWFAEPGIHPDAFLQRFSIDHINNLYKNNKISKATKNKIYDRVLELSFKNKVIKNHINRLKDNNPFYKIINDLYIYKYKMLSNYEFYKRYTKDESINEKKFENNIDWENLEKKAIEVSKQESDKNDLYLNNEWFEQNIRKKMEKFKDSAKNTSYSSSLEYYDLQLFLDVAKELGLKVNLILVPLQGYWADYTGVSHDEIEIFYKNIKEISQKNNVNLIDYSKYSYEPYFFKDTTHFGRLGLLKLQQDLLKYND